MKKRLCWQIQIEPSPSRRPAVRSSNKDNNDGHLGLQEVVPALPVDALPLAHSRPHPHRQHVASSKAAPTIQIRARDRIHITWWQQQLLFHSAGRGQQASHPIALSVPIPAGVLVLVPHGSCPQKVNLREARGRRAACHRRRDWAARLGRGVGLGLGLRLEEMSRRKGRCCYHLARRVCRDRVISGLEWGEDFTFG